jgi:hypothetical protein
MAVVTKRAMNVRMMVGIVFIVKGSYRKGLLKGGFISCNFVLSDRGIYLSRITCIWTGFSGYEVGRG